MQNVKIYINPPNVWRIKKQNRLATKAQSLKVDLRIIKFLCLGVLVSNLIFPLQAAQAAKYQFRSRYTDYVGPGRDQPPRTDVNEILIGYFGPNVASHSQAGDMWCAAVLAIEEANRTGGYNGLPFRLVSAWSDSPWTAGAAHVVRMAYVDKVWAIIGGIDGSSTHLAEQVVTKARLTLINPVSSDKSVNLANVPWMFSCVPADHIQAPALAQAIHQVVLADTDLSAGRLADKSQIVNPPDLWRKIVLISAIDHDSHLFTVELLKSLIPYRISPAKKFEFDPAQKNYNELVDTVISTTPDVLVLITGLQQSAQIVAAIREKGFTGPIFGGPAMGRRSFCQVVGINAEGVVFPLLYCPSSQAEPNDFDSKFLRRFGTHPDYTAAYTYDAVNLAVAAIRQAGLNRARIRDVVRNLSPYKGVTGSINWDGLGSNCRPVGLGTIENGCIQPLVETKPLTSASSVEPWSYLPIFELPSVSVMSWSTAIFSKTSTPPPIQRTSIRSTFVRLPNPK